MANSSLVNCTVKSPNHSGKRTHKIDRITPHCVEGQISAESIGSCFTSTSRSASCNYGIGKDGRVVLIVDEDKRSWCSSSNANDQRAVTIECASDLKDPYAMNTAVYNKLIDLCVDICKRNGISKLIWISDKTKALKYEPKDHEALLTVHRWFANKACPGDWLFNRLGDVANKVNAKLGGTSIEGESEATVEQMKKYIKDKYRAAFGKDAPKSVVDMIKYYVSEGKAEGIRGDIAFAQSVLETGIFHFSGSAVTLDQNNFAGIGVTQNGMKGLSFKTPQLGIRCQIQHLKAYANKKALVNECIDPRFKYVTRGSAPCVEWLGMKENPAGIGWAAGAGYGAKILNILSEIVDTKVPGSATEPKGDTCNYKVKVSIGNLNMRSGPGTNYLTRGYIPKGTYTIVAESSGKGANKWGKLKSGAGWIALDFVKKV